MSRISFGLGVLLVLLSLRTQAHDQDSKAAKESVLSAALSSESQVVIPVSDVDRSLKYYQRLGCSVAFSNLTCASVTGAGLSLRLVKASGFVPSNYPVLVWRFSDLNDAIYKKALQLGQLGLKGEEVKTLPGGISFFEAFTAPVMGTIMKDPDGHILAFIQSGK